VALHEKNEWEKEMSDQIEATEAIDQQPETAVTESTPAEAQNTDHMIPKARFDEVNSKYRELLEQQQQAEQEAKARREKALADQQKWQELAEEREKALGELQPYKERYEAMLERTKAANTSRIEAIPEAMRTIVPDYDDPLKLSEWLDANQEKLVKSPTASLNGGAGRPNRNGSQAGPSLADIKEQAAIYGVDWRHMAQAHGLPVGE
jgi:hypothetical protein